VASRNSVTSDELLSLVKAMGDVLADTSLSDRAVRFYSCLAFNACSGYVHDLKLSQLAKAAGMDTREASAASKELAAAHRIEVSQPGPYKPNHYRIPALLGGGSAPLANKQAAGLGQPSTDDRGAPRGSFASPVGPSSPAASDDGPALADQYADNPATDGVHEDQYRRMQGLLTPLGRSPALWYAVRKSPDGFSPAEIYLTGVLLIAVQGVAPPDGLQEWSLLEETLQSGALYLPETRHQILEAIIEHPPVVHGTSLQAEELSVFRELFGEESDA